MINNDNTQIEENKEPEKIDTPDEHPGLSVQGFLKILDPETGEVIIQGRA